MDTQKPVRTITARELREILFMVKEGTTVEQLRSELFDIELQDKECKIDSNIILNMVPQLYG